MNVCEKEREREKEDEVTECTPFKKKENKEKFSFSTRILGWYLCVCVCVRVCFIWENRFVIDWLLLCDLLLRMVPTTTTTTTTTIIIIIDASHCISKSKSKSSYCQYIRRTVWTFYRASRSVIISEEEDTSRVETGCYSCRLWWMDGWCVRYGIIRMVFFMHCTGFV